MSTLLIYVATATLGWQYGYRPLPDGGMEYTIQFDDAAVAAMRDGQAIESYIPSDVGEVRSFKIIMGKGRLPQIPSLVKQPPAKPIELPTLTPPKAAEKPTPSPLKAAEKPTPPPDEKPSEPKLPWLLLLLTLFASIGANLFLAWIAWGLRKRCQMIKGSGVCISDLTAGK